MSATVNKQFLFEARTRGYHVFRIPGIVVTKAGTILAWCEARKGKGGDWDPIDVCMRRSTDGGESWSEPYLAMDHTRFSADKPTNNFVCIADRETGEIHVLFSNNYERVYSMKSVDDGRSFIEPVEVTAVFESFRKRYPWRVIACGPGHSIQTRTGRLVVPVWMSDGSGTEFGAGKLGHRPSVVALVYSDDHGATWQAGDFVFPNEYPLRNPSETVAVELSDGRLLFNARTESYAHRRAISTSVDGAEGANGWSAPHFDYRLVDPICMGSIIAVPDSPTGGRAIIFANPAVLERTMKGGPGDRGVMPEELGKPFDRKHLGIRLSEDDCASWRWSRRLEDGPSGYSDLAVLADGTILCFYECGIVERMYDDRGLCLARFTLEWIREGVEAK